MKDKYAYILAALFLSLTLVMCLSCNGNGREATEYQFNVDSTGYDIYSDGKIIGRLNYGSNPSLDSLIDNDNR